MAKGVHKSLARTVLLASAVGVSDVHAVMSALPWMRKASVYAHAHKIVEKSGVNQVLRAAMVCVPQLNPASQLMSLSRDVEAIADPAERARERRGLLKVMLDHQTVADSIAEQAASGAVELPDAVEREAVAAVVEMVKWRDNGGEG